MTWTHDVLRFRDTDANGHVNNSVFSVFCESGRVNYLHEVLGSRSLAGTYFVVARLTVEFRAEMYYPGEVRCGTWLAAAGRTSMTFRQALLNEGRLVGNSEAVVVLMDQAARRPMVIEGDLRARIEPLVRP